MFRETLLESAPFNQKRQRWPLATAFMLELLAGSAFVVLPLLTSGVIPVPVRTSYPIFVPQPQIVHADASNRAAPGTGSQRISPRPIVTPTTSRSLCFLNCPNAPETSPEISLCLPNCPNAPETSPEISPSGASVADLSNLTSCNPCGKPELQKRIILSDLAPGSLIHRVDPVYPRMAQLIHVQGVVKLHAIIATDGTIQSLSLIEGAPLLVDAAREAVRQWRYRPYYLNGHPVEVETLITVNFKEFD
jgi:protein TonB